MPRELRSAISVLISESERDPLDVGTDEGVTVDFAEPEFSMSMNAWQCAVTFRGNTDSVTKQIYGEDALQALLLAINFATSLYR